MCNLLIFVYEVTSYVAWSTYICSTNGNAMKNVVLLTRYLLIINKLQREKGRYVMAGELLQHVNRELEYRRYSSDISMRTLLRLVYLHRVISQVSAERLQITLELSSS